MSTSRRPRVVIVGGGFGGLACALALNRQPLDVLVLDAQNYHLFTPLLYQVATALLNPSDIVYPFRTRFRDCPNINFQQARVENVDFGSKALRTKDGATIAYDYLVLATGSANNYFGNPEVARHAMGMKTIGEALRLRNHVLACLEMAQRIEDEQDRQEWFTFVIAGGGPTGVEYAGALAELLRLVLGRDFREVEPESTRIVLVEGKDHLLSGFPPSLGRYAKRKLEGFGIDVKLGVLVKSATARTVELASGEVIPTRTVVWCAGVASQTPEIVPSPQRERGRVQVDETLQVGDATDVFVIGDAAAVSGNAVLLPMLSPPAMQEGRFVADVIKARAKGTRTVYQGFHYRDKGIMATIGRNAAVASVWRMRFTGFLGRLTWLTVHLYYLVGFRNRLTVFWSWGWAYIRKDRPIRIIAVAQADPIADAIEQGLESRKIDMG